MTRPLPSQEKEDTVGPTGAIRKEEFVRVITQSLYSLGYEKSGAVLEEESGIPLFSSLVTLFRKQLLDGKWDDSVVTLLKLGIHESTLKSASFLIYEHKFFELMGTNRVLDALKTLKTEIASLGINRMRVHQLSSYIVSSSLCEHGTETAEARLKLLDEIQKLLPLGDMIPDRRLEHLVEQVLRMQRQACIFHNSSDMLSLYRDHQCGSSKIPSQTIQILKAHHDQVWFLKFSDNGKYLASSSKDKTVIVWEVHVDGVLSLKHTLNGHEKPVLKVAWSPDSQQLLTCGHKEVVRRWDVTSGKCLYVYEKNGPGLVSCGWFPDGCQIFSTSADNSMFLWNLDGTVVSCVEWITKFSDLAITKHGKQIISMDDKILVCDMLAKVDMVIKEQAITSLSLSNDHKFLLVNLINAEIHLWSIVGNPTLVMRYKGHKRSRFDIRSCLGGSEEAFVASGSEDSQVYIWLRNTGDLLLALPGHSGVVNCVSWNPTNPHILASGSDDHTIRIWGLRTTSINNRTS